MSKEKEKEIKIIGFYTANTPYEEEARQLVESLDKFNLSYHLYPIESGESWVENCAQKSNIIKRALDDFSEDILYLDVDARVLRKPSFGSIDRSVPGYCLWTHTFTGVPTEELCSGTIYFPNNSISRQVVDAWIAMQKTYPKLWDQKTLQKVHKMFPHERLHHDWINIQSYIRKGDGKEIRFIETENPIIVHTQASRRNRF